MKVSMSPRFQAAVCMSRTARIWDSSEGDAGVECETAAKKMIAVTAPANKARRNFAGILGSSGIRRNCICSCKEPAGTRAGLRPAATKLNPPAPAARFDEPEPAATNSTAAEPTGARAGLRPAPTKPTAPAARFNEPEPAATNSTAAGQRLAANAAGDNLGTGACARNGDFHRELIAIGTDVLLRRAGGTGKLGEVEHVYISLHSR